MPALLSELVDGKGGAGELRRVLGEDVLGLPLLLLQPQDVGVEEKGPARVARAVHLEAGGEAAGGRHRRVPRLGQEGGHTITCERLRLPPPPPAPRPPPPSSPSPPPAATLWTYSPPSPPPPPPKPAARSAAVANVHVDAPTIAFVGCDTVRLSWPFDEAVPKWRVRWATCVAAKADGCDTGDGVFGGGEGDDKASKLVNAAAAVGGVAVPGLGRHTEYAFRVQPQLVDGQWGAPSAATLARTSERSAPGTGPQPPRVVGAERGHAPSCTEARVRLPPARDGCDAENSFALEYRVAPADDGEWEYWGGKDAAHPPNAVLKIGGLDAASAYEFRVLGRNEDGESPWSDPSKASLAGGDAAPLDAPRATALSSASMLLEWSAPAATAACKLDLKWRVEMRRGQSSGKAGGWEQVATVAAPRAIVREGVRCGLGCSFRVTVLGIDGWNAPSEASPALTGAAPPPPSPPGAVRLLVARAAPRVAAARLSGAEAEREERKWAKAVAAALGVDAGQLAVAEVGGAPPPQAGGGGAAATVDVLIDVRFAETWPAPARARSRQISRRSARRRSPPRRRRRPAAAARRRPRRRRAGRHRRRGRPRRPWPTCAPPARPRHRSVAQRRRAAPPARRGGARRRAATAAAARRR